MTTHNAVSTAPEPETVTKQTKRAALSAFLGGALEYYDFVLFASAAAIIFPTVFFPESNVAMLLSFATFGVAYLARPLGAIILGHIGDKVGRKKALLITLVAMGMATFVIGCLPSFAQVGPIAPVLLVAMRLLQGFSAGGEVAGASSLTIEHAPASRRAFFGSWAVQGVGAGTLLASLVLIPVVAMPDELLFAWGWRLPFLSSILVLALAYFVRRNLEETEAFEETKKQGNTAKVPFFEAFRMNWKSIIRCTIATLFFIPDSIIAVFGAAFALSMGVDRSIVLWSTALANVVALIVRPFAGIVADKFGRKPVFTVGALGTAVMIFFYFIAVSTANIAAIFLTQSLTVGLFIACCGSIYPAFYAEMFTTQTRFTGTAFSLQLGSVLAGFSPTIGTALVGSDPSNWIPVAALTAAALLLAAVAALAGPETYRTPLNHLGLPKGHTKDLPLGATAQADPYDRSAKEGFHADA
jgi:MFS family permease